MQRSGHVDQFDPLQISGSDGSNSGKLRNAFTKLLLSHSFYFASRARQMRNDSPESSMQHVGDRT
jgi:hypothetical protein